MFLVVILLVSFLLKDRAELSTIFAVTPRMAPVRNSPSGVFLCGFMNIAAEGFVNLSFNPIKATTKFDRLWQPTKLKVSVNGGATATPKFLA